MQERRKRDVDDNGPWEMTRVEFERVLRLMVGYGESAAEEEEPTAGGDLTRLVGFTVERTGRDVVTGKMVERKKTQLLCVLHRRMGGDQPAVSDQEVAAYHKAVSSVM